MTANKDERLLANPDWVMGEIRDNRRLDGCGCFGFAAMSGALFVVCVMHGNVAAWLFFGTALAALAVLAPARRRRIAREARFGRSTFRLLAQPGEVGGRLAGTLVTGRALLAADSIDVTLDCLATASGEGPSRDRERSVWRAEQVLRPPYSDDGSVALFPIAFEIPPDARGTSQNARGERVRWRLRVSTPMPGLMYESEFDVPVFAAAHPPLPP